MARQVLENGVVLPAEYSDDWYDDMTSNLTKLDDVIGSDSEKLSSSDVGAAALSNNYNDLDNLPTIPTVNDATLTIQKNGVDVQTFTANASSNVTANITVPTKTSDITNDSNFVDTSNPAVSSGITSAKVTDYDSHIADTDIHVTTADKTSWNTVTSKANDSDVVHKSGDETISGAKTFSDTATFVRVNLEDIRWKSLENQTIDLNDCYIPRAGAMSGYYTKDTSSGSNISNKAANTSFILISLTTRRVSASDYNIRQEFYGSGEKYIRTCSNGTWTAWINETNKFVTTDTAQTIAGNKTFSSNVNVYNSDDTANVPAINLKNSKSEISSSGNTASAQDISFFDKNSTLYANIKGAVQSNGSVIKIRSIAKDSSDNSVINELQILANINGRKVIFPAYTNEVELGDSTYKWKSFNGVEPSSLSLPSGNASDIIDISSYITDLSGYPNDYVAPSNGFVSISATGTGLNMFINGIALGVSLNRATSGVIKHYIPVLKGQTARILIVASSLEYVKFIPCQGNV